jgi:hypothetical protein
MLPEMGPPDTTTSEYPGDDRSWSRELEDFLEDVRTRRDPAPGLAAARRALVVVERVYARSGYRFDDVRAR